MKTQPVKTPEAKAQKPPTFEAIVEERFAVSLAEAIRAWRMAGKPYKR